MTFKQNKSILCLLLVMILAFSLLPLQAWAEEGKSQSATTPQANDATITEIREEIAAFITFHRLSSEMSDEDLLKVYSNSSEDPMIWANQIIALAAVLSEADRDTLAQEENTNLFGRFYTVVDKSQNPQLLATNYNSIDGIIISDDNGSCEDVTDGVKISVGGDFSSIKNTITIKNNSGKKATLSFNYSIGGNYDSFNVNGDSSNKSGTVSKLLASGDSVSIILTSSGWWQTAYIQLTNFNLVEAATTSTVTINYDSNLGSATAGGTAVDSGTAVQNVSLESGIALVATAKSGSTFLGWVNEADGTVLSTSASFTLKPAADMTAKAVFYNSSSNAWFQVGKDHMFPTLTEASAYASESAYKIIVPMFNGTLPAGDYTIPAGVTLLIPFDAAHTLYTNTPSSTGTTYTKPTVYRKLTMASGANITVNGAISLSCKYKSGTGGATNTGSPSGPCSFIHMNESSSITVNNGAALYAWGFITGSGTVTAESGSSIYEYFQFQDWRGGDATSSMNSNSSTYGVFPVSQYYVQNIEVPLTLKAGASEYGFTSVTVTLLGEQKATVKVFGTSEDENCMFRLLSGTASKRYDGTTDRMEFELNGEMDISNVNIEMGIYEFNSQNFDLAINNNVTIRVKSASQLNLTMDIAFLPGVEVYIEEGANCILSEGKNVYIYDADEWGGYCGTYNNKIIPLSYAPGRTYTRTEADIKDVMFQVDGYCDASKGYVYTTKSGASICSTGTGVVKITAGTQESTYQYSQGASSPYIAIGITSAQLLNAYYVEGSNELPLYTTTAGSSNTTYNYNAEHGRWDDADENGNSHIITSEVKDATCNSAGYTTYTCSCGYQYYADYTAPHSNTDCKHKAEELFNIYGTSVQAGDSLNMFFYVKKEHLSGTDYKAVIQRGQPDGTVKTETIPFADWSEYVSDGTALYRFVYSGIAAKEMSEQVFVTICNTDGTILSYTYTDSIEAYALDLLGATDDANLRTALVDMLNYGAACQTHFGYNTAHLANAQLSEEQKGYATSSTPACDAVTSGTDGYKDYFVEHSVSVENSLVYTFVFQDLNTSVTPVVTYTDHYGRAKTLTNLTFQPDGEYYLVDVSGLAIADGCPDCNDEITISCTVTTSASTQITVNGSIEAYAKSAMTVYPNDPVFDMLMRFASSAYRYFHNLPVNT